LTKHRADPHREVVIRQGGFAAALLELLSAAAFVPLRSSSGI
jgi:hypothetical protein